MPTIAVYRLTKEDKTMSKRDYIQANKDWLEAKSKEEGVKALPKGIYYKVTWTHFWSDFDNLQNIICSFCNQLEIDLTAKLKSGQPP